MARYRNGQVSELAAQLVRGPNRLKWRQTLGAERLYRILNPDQAYPYEFVTDYICRFRSRSHAGQRPLIPGRELMHDLPLLIDELSGSGPLLADQAPGGSLFTVEGLAGRFGVSTKTVTRWRTDGLIGRKVRFEDGRVRVAFLPDSVDYFVNTHNERVRRGQHFSRLSREERDQVLRRARRMARRGSRQQVIERIARRMGRSVETIRYIVVTWDQEHPTRALFPDQRRNFTPAQYQWIYEAWRAGRKPKNLAAELRCAASSIYRAICQVRFEEVRQRKPQYIWHNSFTAAGIEEEILRRPIPPGRGDQAANSPPAPADALPYLRDLWGAEVLTAEQEHALFRRYNFLKYLAAREIEEMESSGLVSGRRLDEVEQWLAWADKVRERLIRANLRLVVSIAKKHHGPMTQLLDLVSDGNMVLMRAIEKFDFSRGQKFSTYCTWAIMKHFARLIPESNYQHRWARVIEPEDWRQVASDARVAGFHKPRLEKLRAHLEEGLAVLPERERLVLTEHYGLDGQEPGKTLSQIGRRLGVTKERIRQIEAAALRRLRRLLGPQVLEELAGD